MKLAKVADGFFAFFGLPKICIQTTVTFLGASDGR